MNESEALKWWDEFMEKMKENHIKAIDLFNELDTESANIIEEMLKGKKVIVPLYCDKKGGKKLETIHEVKMLLKAKEVQNDHRD